MNTQVDKTHYSKKYDTLKRFISYHEVVMACEILEHLPFEELESTIQELKRVSKKYVIISVPYPSASVEIVLYFPLIRKLFKINFARILFKLPFFWKTINNEGGKYSSEASRNKVRQQ